MLPTLFVGTVHAQGALYEEQGARYAQQSPRYVQPGGRGKGPGTACKSARTASARLICADPDLAAVDSILTMAIQDAKKASSLDDQKLLVIEQLTWMRERNQKCGLIGKDHAPTNELRSAKRCMENSIDARIADLQNASQTNQDASQANHATPETNQDVSQTNSIPTPAPSGQNLIITPLLQSSSLSTDGSRLHEQPTYQELRFSAPTEGIGGIIDCSVPSSAALGGVKSELDAPLSGQWMIKIAIDDDANSYRMFENDTWALFLDNLRVAVRSSCAGALKSGRLRNSADEPITELSDVFEIYSPQGLFMARSIGQNTPWTLQTNLPKARKKVKFDLGIQTWIEPSQLTRNPYFYKDSVVGVVVRFDQMLSGNEAVFERSGAQIFVSKVPSNLFQDKELVVLAGRVTGNKGVVNSQRVEALMPALDYVGALKCGDACGKF
jgi:uncharacterized protein YecT (DUF1311 family)